MIIFRFNNRAASYEKPADDRYGDLSIMEDDLQGKPLTQ